MDDQIHRDLQALNDLARDVLGGLDSEEAEDPAPDDLPPVGYWIGAYKRAEHELVGVVHQYAGWNAHRGSLTLTCNRFRCGDAISQAYRDTDWRGRPSRMTLRTFAAAPVGACQRCLALIEKRERMALSLDERIRFILEEPLTAAAMIEAIRRLVASSA